MSKESGNMCWYIIGLSLFIELKKNEELIFKSKRIIAITLVVRRLEMIRLKVLM